LIDAARTHVEGHAAALMRQPDAPGEAVLVITREPCDDVSWGCRNVLPDLLPQTRSMHVYVVGDDGEPSWFDSYSGTGKGVRP
jgi:nucleic acid/nucleotide deaminase of polymorphic system toxin